MKINCDGNWCSSMIKYLCNWDGVQKEISMVYKGLCIDDLALYSILGPNQQQTGGGETMMRVVSFTRWSLDMRHNNSFSHIKWLSISPLTQKKSHWLLSYCTSFGNVKFTLFPFIQLGPYWHLQLSLSNLKT